MRPIDADVLIDEIKKDTQKVIKQDDRVGSFWLGYIAGLVIKQPSIQSALDSETLIRTIETGITATNSNDAYSLGMRNGMRWCKSLIDGAEPKFEDDATSVDDGIDSAELPTAQPEPTDINAKEAVYNLAEKIGIHQLFALTVELRGEPIQPEPAIPLSWIENEIKWLKSLDNTFSEITALQISAMVKKWRDEQNERTD